MTDHILIVADGRSPTAQSWIKNIQTLGYSTSLVSTFPCEQPPGIIHFYVLPIAFSRFSAGTSSTPNNSSPGKLKKWVRQFAPFFQSLRYRLGPLTLPTYAKRFQEIVKTIQPDLVHALRIPFEGMLASDTPGEIPFLVSTWGNDLTLHAAGSVLMRRHTRRCLARANGLTSDTRRDVHLAGQFGLSPNAPTLVIPGSGGLDLPQIKKADVFDADVYGIPQTQNWIVNPRGKRPGSVHQDVFFAAIPRVLTQQPEAIFICPSLAGEKHAENWVENLGIQQSTFLLPKLPQRELWSLFKQSALFVSPSSHDGTPNTLLEAMVCGCFPVVGDIESLREWITHGENGYLVDPRDSEALANAMLQALDNPVLREQAARKNFSIVQSRAAQSATLPKIDSFYRQFIA